MPKSMFKKKLFGYAPSDVSSYIEKINSQAAFEIEDIERSVGDLKSQNEALKNEINESRAKLDEAEVLSQKLKDAEAEKEELLKEIESLKAHISECDSRYAALENENSALKVRFDSVSASAESYNKTCQEAGNILVVAKCKADEMQAEAAKKVDIIIASAKLNAEEILSKANTEAKAYYAKTKADADAYALRVKAETDQQVEHNKEKVEYLLKRQKQLLIALQAQKSEISKFYDETVSGLGAQK